MFSGESRKQPSVLLVYVRVNKGLKAAAVEYAQLNASVAPSSQLLLPNRCAFCDATPTPRVSLDSGRACTEATLHMRHVPLVRTRSRAGK